MVGQVMPEPVDLAVYRRALRRGVHGGLGEHGARQYTLLVQQDPVRAGKQEPSIGA